ncbi:hypothetical protein PENSPDRAFT_80331 [Peniophora sp. CONT]|nr:hypothetical protein PENSPDRAFT_80331 [Peniophora sp. CONT]
MPGPPSGFQSPAMPGPQGTFQSPVAPTGPGSFQSPVAPAGPNAFPVFNGAPQQSSRPASASSSAHHAVNAGAFQSPVVHDGPGSLQSPVAPAGPNTFPVFNGPPQQSSRPASAHHGASQFSNASSSTQNRAVVPIPSPDRASQLSNAPSTVQSPVVVSTAPAATLPQPRPPPMPHTQGMTAVQLFELAEHPSQTYHQHTLRMLALQKAREQLQAPHAQTRNDPPPPPPPPPTPPPPAPAQIHTNTMTPMQLLEIAQHPAQAQKLRSGQAEAQGYMQASPSAPEQPRGMSNAATSVEVTRAQAQAQGLDGLPSCPEQHSQPQPQSQPSTSEPTPPNIQVQPWPNMSKTAKTALVQLGDPNSPLRDALRARAGITQDPPASSSSTDIRSQILAELAQRLRDFKPIHACFLLNLNAEQTAALGAVGSGRVEGQHMRVLKALGADERKAIQGLIEAVSAKRVVTVDLKQEEEDSPMAVLTEEPESMEVEYGTATSKSTSTFQQPEMHYQRRGSVMDESPSRRRARSDSGVGTDIEDVAGSGGGGGGERAAKRARMSIDEGVPGEEGEVRARRDRSAEVQQTLTPDATPRLRAAVPAYDSRTPWSPEAGMLEREAVPEDQGSIDPRTLSSMPAPSSAAQTPFIDGFVQGLASAGHGSQMEQILGALKLAESAGRTAERIVEAALPGSSTSQQLQSDSVPPPLPAPPASEIIPPMSALPMERTMSVPIEPTIVVPDTAPTTPTRSREFTPSPYVQDVQPASRSIFDAHLTQPNTTVVHQPEQPEQPLLQSEQLLQMRTQAGYGGPYTGPPPPPIDALPHVPPDLHDDGSGDLPRLPDETMEGKVLGPVHLELAFALDGTARGWVCRMCLHRKEEVDDTFPVPVYPSSEEGTMLDDMRDLMSAHCAQTHKDAFSFISGLSDEAARRELKEMLEE